MEKAALGLSQPAVISDALHRPLRSLRVSVTDRCNLRCAYCMPEARYDWLPNPSLLSFEEIARLVARFQSLGVTKVRLTGGEPLVRRELPTLIEQLSALGLKELALTTNGVLLAPIASALARAGLHRLTVSLDTLSAERFFQLSRRTQHAEVLAGIDAALEAGLAPLKLDTVLMRGVNDDEIVPLLAFARARGAELRFIEYMDVGGATRWNSQLVVSRSELLARLTEAFGAAPRPLPERDSAPAERFLLPDGQVFGIIASTTQPFCGTCDRVRLTADGQLLTCLYATRGTDLRALVRSGADDAALEATLRSVWQARRDRGAEDRARLASLRGPLRTASELAAEPHLQMHRRGG
ncbi:MAG: GTP 3',8-cyclase MoaA [Myxococcota bacterium]